MTKLLFIIMTIGLFGCASPKQEDFVGGFVGGLFCEEGGEYAYDKLFEITQ